MGKIPRRRVCENAGAWGAGEVNLLGRIAKVEGRRSKVEG